MLKTGSERTLLVTLGVDYEKEKLVIHLFLKYRAALVTSLRKLGCTKLWPGLDLCECICGQETTTWTGNKYDMDSLRKLGQQVTTVFFATACIFHFAAFNSASFAGYAAINLEYIPSCSYPAARVRSRASLGACNHRIL